MSAELFKYLIIYLSSTLKFIAGPVMGPLMGMSVIETMLITILGMMTSVLIFSFFGKMIREKICGRIVKSHKKFSRKNRRFISIWNRYGIFGVSFLTPVIFSPIGGTILVTAMTGSAKRKKIFFYMFISALFWSSIFTFSIYFLQLKI